MFFSSKLKTDFFIRSFYYNICMLISWNIFCYLNKLIGKEKATLTLFMLDLFLYLNIVRARIVISQNSQMANYTKNIIFEGIMED